MKAKYLMIALPIMVISACNKQDSLEMTEGASFIANAVTTETTKTTLETDGSTYTMSWTGDETVHMYPMPTTYPKPDDGLTDREWPSTYWPFTNSASGAQAVFTPTSWTGSFETGVPYLVLSYKVGDYLRRLVFRATNSVDDVTVILHKFYVPHSSNQTFNPANSMGLANNSIRLYGVIEKGKGAGFEPTAVAMHTTSAILRLRVTNNSGVAKVIDHITLTSSVGPSTSLVTGICGNQYIRLNPADYSITSQGMYTGTPHDVITLDCGDFSLANGATQDFSFVIPGGHTSRSHYGDLTWDIYEDGNATPIATAQNLASTGINFAMGKVYTKTVTL